MSTIINGSSPSITFSDSTTQASAGLTSSSTLNASDVTTGTLPSAQLPAGSVLQVVQGSYSTYTTTTSTSLVSTGLTASITPKFSTSKILVLVNPNMAISYGTAAIASLQLQITRGATQILYQDRAIAINAGTGGGGVIYSAVSLGLSVLDSPATTSATTYTLNFAVANGSMSGRINDYSSTTSTNGSTITLMEIAA